MIFMQMCMGKTNEPVEQFKLTLAAHILLHAIELFTSFLQRF